MKLGLIIQTYAYSCIISSLQKHVVCSHIISILPLFSHEKGVVTATDETTNYGLSTTFDPIWRLESMQAFRQRLRKWMSKSMDRNFSPAD